MWGGFANKKKEMCMYWYIQYNTYIRIPPLGLESINVLCTLLVHVHMYCTYISYIHTEYIHMYVLYIIKTLLLLEY